MGRPQSSESAQLSEIKNNPIFHLPIINYYEVIGWMRFYSFQFFWSIINGYHNQTLTQFEKVLFRAPIVQKLPEIPERPIFGQNTFEQLTKSPLV